MTKALIALILCACAVKQPLAQNKSSSNDTTSLIVDSIDYELYLVGDISSQNSDLTQSDIVDLIKSELTANSVDKSVVFLGNSFGESGFPDEETQEFYRIDAAISKCISQLKDHTDKVYFIPGNTEWYDGKEYTVSALHDVEEYIESKVGEKNIFAPSHGCGEPKVVELMDDLLLLLVDSQWVIQGSSSNQRKKSGCDIDDEQELAAYIEHLLARHKDKNVIIAAHHPVFSNGHTGGNYGAASHLLPLPVLGSLITGVKKIGGGRQKFGHPQYETYRSTMLHALSNFEGVIHVSAHDRNLQYHHQDNNHFIVAGSGAHVDYVRKKGTADFTLRNKGFAKITHTKNHEIWLEFYIPDGTTMTKAKSIFKRKLLKKEVIDYTDQTIYKQPAELPTTKKVQASTQYEKRKFGIGATYRKAWSTEVEVPVLLLDNVHGGLEPVREGGGFQTRSLRLENSNGQQWVLRSVDKNVTKVVPVPLRKTLVSDLIQDGISSSHPYGAMVIPPLADAAGVYHANPQYVWLPAQKALGDFNTDFSERLYLFEERPGGNLKGHKNYGGATESINTLELVTKLYKNHKHKVDQAYVLKARLLDFLIGDWDRHDDQWRWGIYKSDTEADKKIYRAIPRDRDQVFFKNDGFIQYIASRPYIAPGLRKFDHELDFIDGFNFNARHFDRHFLSELNEESFLEAASNLQSAITDEVIQKALARWPEEIYVLNGNDIRDKLKSRRENLVDYAKEYYKYLSKEVTAIGTNHKNVFEVVALPNDQLDVRVYHLDKDDKSHLIWSRIISGDQTDELRLYGLKGKDTFSFSGSHKSSVKINLVGGSGEDTVQNDSEHLNIKAHDKVGGMSVNGNRITTRINNNKGVNSFDRKDWELNRSLHFPMITFYTDEGAGISYNVLWTKNGFRKKPFASTHRLKLSYFRQNSAFVGNYSGHWTSIWGPDWGLKLNASFTGPTFTQFFYGLGNEFVNYEEVFPDTQESGSPRFHIVRGTHLDINSDFTKTLRNNNSFTINPSLEYIDLTNSQNALDDERFIFSEEAGRSTSDFDSKLYIGLGVNYKSTKLNNVANPTRGYVFTIGADYKQSLSSIDFSNLTLESSIAAYIPFTITHKVVVATYIGGAYTFGGYEFFHANYLSNQSRLRGFRTNRFAGDGIVYHASDLRIKLLEGKGGLRTGLGVFGSFDYGRAFLEDERISTWHTSIGGGIYLTPFDLVGFKIGYYVGEDDAQISLGGALSF